MKILLISSSFYPTRGGAQNYVYNLAKKLLSKGHEVTVFTGSNYMETNFNGINNYEWDGIHVVQMKTKRFHGLVIPVSISGLNELNSHLKNVDVVHLNDIRFLSFILIILKRLYKFRLFLTSHGFIYHNANASFFKNIFMKFFSLFSGKYDSVFTISKQDNEIAKRFNLQNTCFVQEGVAIETFLEVNSESVEGTFVYFGRVAKNKGIHLLIKCLARVNEDFTFHIVGKAEEQYLEVLKKEIANYGLEKNIIWHGAKDDQFLKELLARAEFVFLPSTFEGFGITLIESLASDTKVIANEIPTYTAILNNLKLEAMLFNYNEADEFEGKIMELRNKNFSLRENLGKYSFGEMVDQIVDNYKK